MKFPLYSRTADPSAISPADLPSGPSAALHDPSLYDPDPGLVDAVNVALMLGQPLLITGEPGTGKTELASHLAWQLRLGTPLVFEAKSTSVARDLFYTYDTLGRFHAAQTGARIDPWSFLKYNALGLAIIRANDPEHVKEAMPNGFDHGGQRRSVVLIDEIDKAPRDFPNDLLNEIEKLYFRIPELGNMTFAAETATRPIVVITSNSEKQLPDPFLRRCIYYDIPFPDRSRLSDIIARRIGARGPRAYSRRGDRFLHAVTRTGVRASQETLHRRVAGVGCVSFRNCRKDGGCFGRCRVLNARQLVRARQNC